MITEAGFKSGTIHTKEFALEYGRDVFAVPGNVTNSKSELTNHIIKTAQAEVALSPDDIIEFYGFKTKAKEKKVLALSFDEQKIIELLEDEERDFDYLAENSKIPVNILNSCLTTLEIRGLIRKLPAQTYALI
ncbi:MAG: DNA-processing protein DprA [Clostridia bacterium]|nr:DNA-processing protein DprA [Clostridia bacterium]